MQHKVVDIPQNDQNGSFLHREHWIVQYVITDGSFATSAIESKTIHPNLLSKDASNFWAGDLPEVDFFLTHEQKKSIEV